MESLLGGVEEERRELDSVEEERRELGGVEEERRELGGVKEERREQGEESFGERTLKATSDNKLEEEPCEPQGANTTSSTSPNTDVTSSACPSEGPGGGTLSPRTGGEKEGNCEDSSRITGSENVTGVSSKCPDKASESEEAGIVGGGFSTAETNAPPPGTSPEVLKPGEADPTKSAAGELSKPAELSSELANLFSGELPSVSELQGDPGENPTLLVKTSFFTFPFVLVSDIFCW